jgi:hypothetical protein
MPKANRPCHPANPARPPQPSGWIEVAHVAITATLMAVTIVTTRDVDHAMRIAVSLTALISLLRLGGAKRR